MSYVQIEDGTRHSLAYCRDCPGWRVLTADRAAANVAAAEHSDRTHGDNNTAREFRRRARNLRA